MLTHAARQPIPQLIACVDCQRTVERHSWHDPQVDMQLVSDIASVKVIAAGRRIRELERLRKVYGPGRWRKLKGVAQVQLPDGSICTAEVHWYEAHGVGRKEVKVKRIMRQQRIMRQ